MRTHALSRPLFTGLIHLSLGLWTGATAMLALAAAGTFKTIRAYQPTLNQTPYDHFPNLHSDILAGAVVNTLVDRLFILQKGCALVLLACLIARRRWHTPWLRLSPHRILTGLIAATILLLVVQIASIRPNMDALRTQMYDTTLTTAEQTQARQAFDIQHKRSERAMAVSFFLLVGAVLIVPFTQRELAVSG